MAGHSKWATTKRKKAKIDAARGKVFTRIGREITVAAKAGGGDPAGNAHLRMLLDQAKASNMPQENITRAIKKGTGELEGATYEAITYEGYGPGGIAIIVETLTDNKNRTAADMRHVFGKLNGNLASTGSVNWMFEHKGIVIVKAEGTSEDDILEKLIDHDIEEINASDGEFTIQCAIADLAHVKDAAVAAGLTVESAELAWVAKEPVELDESVEEKAFKLLDAIEEIDDVQQVYANVK